MKSTRKIDQSRASADRKPGAPPPRAHAQEHPHRGPSQDIVPFLEIRRLIGRFTSIRGSAERGCLASGFLLLTGSMLQ